MSSYQNDPMAIKKLRPEPIEHAWSMLRCISALREEWEQILKEKNADLLIAVLVEPLRSLKPRRDLKHLFYSFVHLFDGSV